MWPIVFLGLLIASLVGWAFTWWQQKIRIRQLERSKEEIQIEETLVFDFLHGLGEAFTETIRAADLHRVIVEGAASVLDALGGAKDQPLVKPREAAARVAVMEAMYKGAQERKWVKVA
jgi:sigma-B regulation protein RsbU (phosphoserine phosphatase)